MRCSIDLLVFGGHEECCNPNQLEFSLLELCPLQPNVYEMDGEKESFRLQFELHMHIHHPVQEDGSHALSHLGLEVHECVECTWLTKVLEVL